MRLSSLIAKRYLFAKKSHNVINIISLISAIGIAVGSCALVLVLSTYNGFEEIVRGMYDESAPDLTVSSRTAKFFQTGGEAFRKIRNNSGIALYAETIEEHAFIRYDQEEGVILIKGVDGNYAADSSAMSGIIDGSFQLYQGEIPHAVTGRKLASDMQILPRFLTPIEIYFPDRNRNISMSNPSAALNRATFFPSGIFSSGIEKYNSTMFLPIEKVRSLIGLDADECGAVEIRLHPGTDGRKLKKEIQRLLGDDFRVLDREQQNETVYKMMKVEKAVIFMILLFILIIISCNVYGSLTMLIIEKIDDIHTLQHLGADSRLIGNIFFKEGWMIILLGSSAGILLGILLAVLQQQIGIIEMPGNFVVRYYPVVIRISDLIITFLGIAAAGFVITYFPAKKTLSKIL